jgi:hypothetical protein
MTQTPAPDETADAQQQEPVAAPGERRALVRFGIALAAALFVAAAGVLYLRWATMREPMCVFIVEATDALRGAEVAVDGINIAEPHTATIGRGERFAIPFYLDYGTYTVRVTMNAVAIVETEVTLDHNRPYQKIDLKDVQAPPPPAPTTSSSSSSTPRAPDFLTAETDAVRVVSPLRGGGAP